MQYRRMQYRRMQYRCPVCGADLYPSLGWQRREHLKECRACYWDQSGCFHCTCGHLPPGRHSWQDIWDHYDSITDWPAHVLLAELQKM